MISDSGCLGCTKRRVGCHSDCARFLAYRKRMDMINARRKRLRENESLDFRKYKKGR